MTEEIEGLKYNGLHVIVNNYVPDNCIVVNVALYKKLIKDMENDSSTAILPIRSNK